jgi:hypothetical protein
MPMSITSKSPLDVTPLPRAIPPMARKTIVHANCSKSSCNHRRAPLGNNVEKSISTTKNVHATHLLQHPGREKRHDRQDGDDPHITNHLLDPVLHAPQSDSNQTHERDPPLFQCKWFLGRAYRLDLDVPFAIGRASWSVAHQQQQPDEHEGDPRHGQRDCEPLGPIQWRIHRLQRNQILRGGYWRTLPSNVRRERYGQLKYVINSVAECVPAVNTHDQSRTERGLGRQRPQNRL